MRHLRFRRLVNAVSSIAQTRQRLMVHTGWFRSGLIRLCERKVGCQRLVM
jgi:hypothetical protein